MRYGRDFSLRAISVGVYRHGKYDCTNGGISSRFDDLLCLCDEGPVHVDMDNPPENLVKLVRRDFCGEPVYHIEPVAEPKDAGWMMGGNYAATSDARFSRMIGNAYCAIAIHDRQESWKEYEMYSS